MLQRLGVMDTPEAEPQAPSPQQGTAPPGEAPSAEVQHDPEHSPRASAGGEAGGQESSPLVEPAGAVPAAAEQPSEDGDVSPAAGEKPSENDGVMSADQPSDSGNVVLAAAEQPSEDDGTAAAEEPSGSPEALDLDPPVAEEATVADPPGDDREAEPAPGADAGTPGWAEEEAGHAPPATGAAGEGSTAGSEGGADGSQEAWEDAQSQGPAALELPTEAEGEGSSGQGGEAVPVAGGEERSRAKTMTYASAGLVGGWQLALPPMHHTATGVAPQHHTSNSCCCRPCRLRCRLPNSWG